MPKFLHCSNFAICCYNYYQQETDDLYLRRLYNKKMKPNPPLSRFTIASEGINRIRTEFHGFLASDKT